MRFEICGLIVCLFLSIFPGKIHASPAPLQTTAASAAANSGSAIAGNPISINVQAAPYGAKGDGQTDDTQAFQKALDDAHANGGGTVFVPTGKYLIRTHLVVPSGVSLLGVGRAPMSYTPQTPGSTLLAVEGAGHADGTPFLMLRGPNATVQGITVFYPKQVISETPTPYPWTIRGSGDNDSILDVLLVNPFQGVDFGTYTAQRHYVRGLYGQPLLKGLWIDKCTDIGRIQDVHFWPFWTQDKRIVDFTTSHGTSFIFQRTDWEVVQDVFSWGYHVGIDFSSSPEGAMNGQMVDVNLDNVDIGLDIRATQPYAVHIANLNIANAGAGTHHIGIWGHKGSEKADLTIRGASFWGSLKQVMRWENPGDIILADSRLNPWNSFEPVVELLAGRAIIHDNFFVPHQQGPIGHKEPSKVAIHVGPGIQKAMIHGNELSGNTIKNQAGTRALLSDNQP